jgi:predicted O-methyltransferase YrrM
MSVIGDAALKARIETLQAASAAQEAETIGYFIARAQKGDLTWDGLDDDANRFMADKMVALEPIKAEFCHMLCRALRATRVVEVGTSFGVSTLYLADAVRANGGGVVIGTE